MSLKHYVSLFSFTLFSSSIYCMHDYSLDFLYKIYGNTDFSITQESYNTIVYLNHTTGERHCITPWKSNYILTKTEKMPAHFLAEYIKRNPSVLTFIKQEEEKQQLSHKEAVITILYEYLRISDCTIQNANLSSIEDMYLGTYCNGNMITFYKNEHSEKNITPSKTDTQPVITLSELILASGLSKLTATAIENSSYPLPRGTYKILFFPESYPKEGTSLSVSKTHTINQYCVNYATEGHRYYHDYNMLNILPSSAHKRQVHWDNRLSILHKSMNNKNGERQIYDIHVVRKILSFLVPTNSTNTKPLTYTTPILVPSKIFHHEI